MNCIICNKKSESISIEHIVPESLGNKKYVMLKGSVCDTCNNKFSKFEDTALANSIFVMERAINGIPTKKGKTAKGKIQGLEIEGDEKFRKNHTVVSGLNSKNTKDFNPRTKEFVLRIESFDKSQVATSKLLLKMAIESIYKSKKRLFDETDFEELRGFLKGENNKDWAFITSKYKNEGFNSIPKYTDRHRLKRINCEMKLKEVDDRTLLFNFKYGIIEMVINLKNRDLIWANQYLTNDEMARLYPEHFREKLKKRLK